MDYNTEILSLWIGPESQKLAHHFYSLQAEQFFDDGEDPTDHRALWALSGNHDIEKTPKMMVFDTKSDHLTRIRKVNHTKILKKMSETSKCEFSFNYFAPSQAQEQPVQVDKQACLYNNWSGKEDNYVLIDTKFDEDSRAFSHWESLYKAGSQLYEDRIRKRLEKLDFLHILNFCTDGTRLGFTNSLLSHFQDQCPKKSILFTNLSQSKNQQYIEEVCLPLLSEISQDVTIMLDIELAQPEFEYFDANFYHHFSPLFNCLLTPFMLKKASSADFFNQICLGKRNLFDLAFTLPIISDNNQLSNSTNIFNYLPESHKKREESEINRINFANKSYINVPKHLKKDINTKKNDRKQEKVIFTHQKILAEAYVLKGHFNEIAKLCNQRTPQFDVKYLQGIFITNPEYNLHYTDFYKKSYGQKVEAFPMQTALYQSCAFGPAIRNYLKETHSKLLKNELINQWKEGAICLSDLYSQQADVDSD